MKSVFEKAFAPYGRVHEGYDLAGLLPAMEAIPLPEEGTSYLPVLPALEEAGCFRTLEDRAFGGLPIQIGMCWGRNTRLNCLEYHRSSEFNVGTHPFVLLLAHQWDIEDGKLDTGKVEAFFVPAGALVEVYATTLHYAPCHTDPANGFKVLVALPKGTNTDKPNMPIKGGDDAYLWACNKWLLAHPDSAEAAQGAVAALTGENIDIEKDL